LRQHRCGNSSRCALQKTPDERAADAEAHYRELVDPQMIHQAELVVGIGFPWALDLDRAGGLAARSVAQVRRDAAILSLELLDRIKGRVAGKEGNGRVQPSARKQQQWEAGTGLFIVDPHRASFIELASPSFTRLLSKHSRHCGGCRCRRSR